MLSKFTQATGLLSLACTLAFSSCANTDSPAEVFSANESNTQDLARQDGGLDGDGVFYVANTNAERPSIRFTDGQISVNRTCAIQKGNKLNRKIPPCYVNGRPVAFC